MNTLIEKLEHLRDTLHKLSADFSHDTKLRLINEALGICKAINIVKEHKCIWKGVYNSCEESTHYTLSCGNEYFDNYMGEDVECFKYCPFCGGEIDFSEVQP